MGKVYSRLTRPIRTFNIENRAERIISREKPIPTPEYPSVQKQKDVVEQIKPDFMEHHYKKDTQLHEHLKNVYVSSTDPQPEQISSVKYLPQEKSESLLDKDIGDVSSDKLQLHFRDKCSFKEIIEFINMYQENPTENTIDTISKKYLLDKQVIRNVVNHFKIFSSVDVQQKKLESDKKNK